MSPLIPFPSFPVASQHRYRISARPTRTFHTVLDAAALIDADDGRHSVVTFELQSQEIVARFEHPFVGGLIRETLTLRREGGGLRAVRLVRVVDGIEAGRPLRVEEVDFADSAWPLPPATYPETALPFLVNWLPFDGQVRDLYAWINDRFVARMQLQSLGERRIELPAGATNAIELILYPDLNDWVHLGRALTRLVRPFLPKYRVWYATEPPHTLLRYEGPYGPPGAPELILEHI